MTLAEALKIVGGIRDRGKTGLLETMEFMKSHPRNFTTQENQAFRVVFAAMRQMFEPV